MATWNMIVRVHRKYFSFYFLDICLLQPALVAKIGLKKEKSITLKDFQEQRPITERPLHFYVTSST